MGNQATLDKLDLPTDANKNSCKNFYYSFMTIIIRVRDVDEDILLFGCVKFLSNQSYFQNFY